MTLCVVHDLAPSRATSSTEFAWGSARQSLARAAVIVVVLGALPFVWDAHPAWQVLGALVAVAVAGRAVQLAWRVAFSTDPRHLPGD